MCIRDRNVDKNRSADNVEFCQEDIKQVYHKLFDEARERYNAKQKRKDRMIDNYYKKSGGVSRKSYFMK